MESYHRPPTPAFTLEDYSRYPKYNTNRGSEMRLLYTKEIENGKFEIKEFTESEIPRYAILSHTWEQGEILVATINENETMVNLLLRYGAYPDVQDRKGRTPLLLVTIKENESMIDILLDNHANTDVKDLRYFGHSKKESGNHEASTGAH